MGEKKNLSCILTLEFNTFSEAAVHFYKACLFVFFFFKELMDCPLLICPGEKNKADMPLSLGFVAERQINLTVDT